MAYVAFLGRLVTSFKHHDDNATTTNEIKTVTGAIIDSQLRHVALIGCQSPKFPASTCRNRALMRTRARLSLRSSSQSTNSSVWRTVYMQEIVATRIHLVKRLRAATEPLILHCIHLCFPRLRQHFEIDDLRQFFKKFIHHTSTLVALKILCRGQSLR